MTTIIKSPQDIVIHNLDRFTIEQFINNNHSDDAFLWCSGYLIKLSFFGEEVFNKQIFEHDIWHYTACDIAPMPEFKAELQNRYSKTPVYDMTGNQLFERIIKDIT